jgi:hypothetical protein
MRFNKLSVRKAVVAVLILHLLACMAIALGCWLNPASTSQRTAAAVPSKPAPRALAQRGKTKPMPFAHVGHCFVRPRKS